MLISFNHFYVTSCTNTLCSVDVSVSVNSNINSPSTNIFDKTSNFSFCNSSRLSYDVRKYQKTNLLVPKCSRNSDNMNILSFFSYFCFLLIFLKTGKRKNDPHLKIILTSIAFLVCILYRFSKLHNRLKSCFTCQFFTHGTIEITNEVNISHPQSEMRIFAISKFKFKNDNSFCPLLLQLLGDISLNPGSLSNPQLFKQEEWQAFSNRELHLINLNINSLLPKIHEFRDVAKRTKAAVIGV